MDRDFRDFLFLSALLRFLRLLFACREFISSARFPGIVGRVIRPKSPTTQTHHKNLAYANKWSPVVFGKMLLMQLNKTYSHRSCIMADCLGFVFMIFFRIYIFLFVANMEIEFHYKIFLDLIFSERDMNGLCSALRMRNFFIIV